jgi:phosphoribosylamine--glycine ligase
MVDDLEAAGVRAFGPTRNAARLEGSKAFTKELCAKASIPTARFARFTDAIAAKAHVRAAGAPIVVKADGLAAGKGVVVASSVEEADAAIDTMLGGSLGAAGAELVIEECLVGVEASFLRFATARARSRSEPRRTTSAPSMGTQGPTPEAWARTRRPPA